MKRKAHEYRIENPDKTWEEIQNRLITKDLTFTVSTDGTVKQTNDKISSLEAQIKELTSLIRNNEVSAFNSGSFKDPNVKGRPNVLFGRRFTLGSLKDPELKALTSLFLIRLVTIAVIMGILFLTALNIGLMKDFKK